MSTAEIHPFKVMRLLLFVPRNSSKDAETGDYIISTTPRPTMLP